MRDTAQHVTSQFLTVQQNDMTVTKILIMVFENKDSTDSIDRFIAKLTAKLRGWLYSSLV